MIVGSNRLCNKINNHGCGRWWRRGLLLRLDNTWNGSLGRIAFRCWCLPCPCIIVVPIVVLRIGRGTTTIANTSRSNHRTSSLRRPSKCGNTPRSKFINLGHVKDTHTIQRQIKLTESRDIPHWHCRMCRQMQNMSTLHLKRCIKLRIRATSHGIMNLSAIHTDRTFARDNRPCQIHFMFFSSTILSRQTISHGICVGKAKLELNLLLCCAHAFSSSENAKVHHVRWIQMKIVFRRR
mmetsp:Transcript_46933/g.69799  ORF Transcript_46933/g.69799 Transcript_46933/m.69799 type:complete len:237 (+) Transcript_46933:979-1689(+)